MDVFVSGDADNRWGAQQPDRTLSERRPGGVPRQWKVSAFVHLFQFSDDRSFFTYGTEPINPVVPSYTMT
jgi:hypothetical protein